jgi:ESCRT-II complex subunit VPS22
MLHASQGVWAEMLGFGDFYYELGVQIVEASLATRSIHGGLMDLPSLLKYVQRRRGSQSDPITEDDVIRAIKKLKMLGNGFDHVIIGHKSYVRCVPGELNTDKNKVLELAQGKGYVSKQGVIETTGWREQRVDDLLTSLLKEGLAMVDEGAPDGVVLYWFPCCSTGAASGAA